MQQCIRSSAETPPTPKMIQSISSNTTTLFKYIGPLQAATTAVINELVLKEFLPFKHKSNEHVFFQGVESTDICLQMWGVKVKVMRKINTQVSTDT